MQIIQGIRDKGAAIVIGVIALSLIGFILMDAKQGTSRMFSSNSTSIGKINGSSVDQADFNKRVKMQEDQQEQRSGRKPSVTETAGIRDQMWNTIVAEKVFYAEAAKLGIDFTAKELSAILSSNDQENPLLQEKQLLDSTTGKLDPAKLKQALVNIKKMTPEQREMFDVQIVDQQRITSISTKYMSLLNASAYYPTWMEDKDTRENKNFANISYVAIPFNAISDSTIKVSDDDIQKYVQSHKELFKQEAGRTISYVAFSQLPGTDDSVKAKETVTALKDTFAAEKNVKSFLARNTSSIDFDSNYVNKAKVGSAVMDSITKLPMGAVYGPYVDKGSYVLARVLGTKTVPDSVKARHILIATTDRQTGQPIMTDSAAKILADSILKAVKGGMDFGFMALKYSADQSNKLKGGDLGTFGYGAMVSEFNDFCFTKPTGTIDVVKTQFGYHIVQIQSQKGSSPTYKMAFMGKEILASETTINKASLDATKLAADKDPKKFDTTNLKKMGLQKITVPDLIKENDAQVGRDLQEARQLVRWVFDAKKGDISDPFNIGDRFVVAIVDKVMEEGLQDVQTARPKAEAAIRDEKKGEEILKKLGNTPTLESAAAAFAKQVLTAGEDSTIIFTAKIINNIGVEPKVVGACFNKENLTKVSAPILGKNGVYVLKVNSIGTKAADTPEQLTEKRKQGADQQRNQAQSNWFEGLKNQATIKDGRSKFY